MLVATRRVGLWVISCRDGKLPERENTLRKPLLPNLGVADAMCRFLSFNYYLFS